MKPFENVTREGNEKAIRKGRVVPQGDVNLAYVRSPELSPKENVVIVDTSRIVEENIASGTQSCKLYYANPIGVLVNEEDNVAVSDEYPVVTDVFSVDEDFSVVPGNEYTDESILPYVHVSRYFHLDHAGLAMGDDQITYHHEAIKVVDRQGNEYSNYRIKITPVYIKDFDEANLTSTGGIFPASTWGYRVFAYIDTDSDSEELYLTYNKIEVEDDGTLVRRQIGYRELLNPKSFFSYTPEESDVVDPVNRERKLYSSKPIAYKGDVIGDPSPKVDGYRIFVPKKAVGDPRLYQLFRWRVKCRFTQEVTVDPSKDFQTVRCGVLVTGADLATSTPSRAPYALLNLARSRYNASGVIFQNPAQPNHDKGDQERRDYWFVNIDTADLSQYDLLIWAPSTPRFDFSPYAGKIDDFVSNHGGTVFVDANTWTDPQASLGGRTSVPFHPANGRARVSAIDGASAVRGSAKNPRWQNTSHALIDGNTQLGGWRMLDQTGTNNPMIDYMSYTQTYNRQWTQHFGALPPGYTTLIQVTLDGTSNTWRTVTAARQVNSGHKIYSTFGHLFTCSALFSYVDNRLITGNTGSRISSNDDYARNINGVGNEGAMKLLYNAALLAVRGRALDASDQEEFSTSWSYHTPWRSSWVIDASDDVLSQQEKQEHDFLIDARDIHADTPDTTPVWKRRLSNRTIRQLVDDAIAPIMDNPGTRNRIEGSAREYIIELTNPYVQVGSKVVENDYPHAWTEAFTPKFTVPTELGPHIIKEEIDSAGMRGRVAQYDDANYVHREYPEKPYAGQVTATYTATEEIAQNNETDYTATGTAIGTIKITTTIPAKTISKTSDVDLSWWDSQVATRPSSSRGNPLKSGTMWSVNSSNPRAHPGMLKANGITPWADRNYYTNDWGPGHLCFPYWGHTSRQQQGSSGDRVRFIQEALNRFMSARYITGRKLTVDGAYGPLTRNAVSSFQSQIKARWVDGVVDAETWSLIAIQMHRLAANGKLGSVNSKNYTKWFGWHDRIQPHRISNSNSDWVAKRSWRSGGPSVIWELYAIKFRESYKFHGVTILPYVPGAYDRMMVRSIHVGNNTDMRNFNSTKSQLKYMSHRPRNGKALYIPMGPYTGNTITVGVGQDKSSGWGSARVFGIRDIRGHTRITDTTTIPSKTLISYQQEDINFTVTGSTSVESFKDRTIQLQTPKWNQYHSVSNIVFNNISVSNPEVVASVTASGKATFKSQIVATNSGTEILQGQPFPAPGFAYHSIDEEGRFNPVPETGWVSKADGIKLLCNNKKRPIGFPGLPTNVGTNEAQRHYVKMSLGTTGTDGSVQMGFYDYAQKEFITSVDGKPEISFIEYLTRGPHNIYIAVISDYENANEEVIPVDEDAPRLPYRWAMPVYGVCTKAGSKITLESLPDRLGPHDVWPIAVREGKFVREATIRPRWEGGLTNYLQNYQGTKVHAFYDIPEADMGGYSRRYGPPNADITDEEPIIVDDDVLQVRQAPILMVQHPTKYPNASDPVRPVITLYKRDTRNSPWVEQPFSDIRDFNAHSGEIFLRQRLTSNDSSLLRVDYTTTRRHYQFKRDGDLLLNLNAYSGHTRDLMGEAIYVYIVPHFVKDELGNVILDSYQERTLRVTLNSSVFDPLQPEYDQLAIQLGVVYISTALDISRLAILDTRRRGGGIADNANVREVTRLVNDAATFWDIGYATGGSYQKSGYIVIRLPDELRNAFSEEEIVEVVKRNIGAGIGFKLENLQGEDWS